MCHKKVSQGYFIDRTKGQAEKELVRPGRSYTRQAAGGGTSESQTAAGRAVAVAWGTAAGRAVGIGC